MCGLFHGAQVTGKLSLDHPAPFLHKTCVSLTSQLVSLLTSVCQLYIRRLSHLVLGTGEIFRSKMSVECKITYIPCRSSGYTQMTETNQPTLRSRVLLEKPIITQLVKIFLAFYGTRRFITLFTRARHWFLT
jgi:hypothetical protein